MTFEDQTRRRLQPRPAPTPTPARTTATATARSAPRASLNAAHPVPRLRWALDDGSLRRLHTVVGPHTTLRACWWCPVCDAAVHRRFRPGRQRVYCTNACRQKAYRSRRRERQRLALDHCGPRRPERAQNRDRAHAIRDFRDVATGRRDSTGRGVTACGAFARMSIDTPGSYAHVEFRAAQPFDVGFTCRRCQQLSGVAQRPPVAAELDRRVSPGGP